MKTNMLTHLIEQHGRIWVLCRVCFKKILGSMGRRGRSLEADGWRAYPRKSVLCRLDRKTSWAFRGV